MVLVHNRMLLVHNRLGLEVKRITNIHDSTNINIQIAITTAATTTDRSNLVIRLKIINGNKELPATPIEHK